jgi:hypothetical protein
MMANIISQQAKQPASEKQSTAGTRFASILVARRNDEPSTGKLPQLLYCSIYCCYPLLLLYTFCFVVPQFCRCTPIDNTEQEIERELRNLCPKVRVVEKLSGAHLKVAAEDSSSLAVRIYYPSDIERLEEHLQKEGLVTEENLQERLEKFRSGSTEDECGDVDGLVTFKKNFKCTVVILILPEGSLDQLMRSDSFLHRVQRIMRRSLSPADAVRAPKHEI